MTVSLSAQDAAAKIAQVDSAAQQAISLMRNIENNQSEMAGSSWHGDSSTKYVQVSGTQRDDFESVIKFLQDIVEKGKSHINSLVTQDQG
jgi:uncharacterized protein YukE